MRSAPKKELKTDEEPVACDVCGRTILKGERTEPFLAPGGRHRTVCELCIPRADHEGWIRESAHNELPAARSRPQQRRSLLGRLRGREDGDREPLEAEQPQGSFDAAEPAPEVVESDEVRAVRAERPARRQEPAPPRRDSRHIRAVPTTAEVKIERALEVFNASEHPRTIGGIARTLGMPWVHASPDAGAPSAVTIVVAWELSWYRYQVDLGDAGEPITLVEKGDELSELEEPLREWNALADDNGRLAAM